MKILVGIIVLLVVVGLALWAFFAYVEQFRVPKPATTAHPTPAAPAAGHGTDGHAGGHDSHHAPGGLIGFGQGLVWLALGGFLLIGGGMLLAKMWGFDGKAPALRSHNYDSRFAGATPTQSELGVWQFFTSDPTHKEPIDSVAGYDTVVCNLTIDPQCVDPTTTGYHVWCVPWKGGSPVPYDPVACKDHRQLLISADKPNTNMAYYRTPR